MSTTTDRRAWEDTWHRSSGDGPNAVHGADAANSGADADTSAADAVGTGGSGDGDISRTGIDALSMSIGDGDFAIDCAAGKVPRAADTAAADAASGDADLDLDVDSCGDGGGLAWLAVFPIEPGAVAATAGPGIGDVWA